MTLRINDAALQQILQTYSPKGKAAPNPIQLTEGLSSDNGDSITLSNQGQELQQMIKAAQQAGDVRAELVQELKQRLMNGSYQLDPQLIANNMLGLSGGAGD
ncbi:MAG TPA: flagellar biosynthesis anti-sigma factor FlgM [Chloroflexota bacterium]|nr:flagellar biosynthesis anti-sigma factor FlgM [Chloroflexota bacterium]